MKLSKKILSLALIGIMSTFIFTACSGEDKSNQQQAQPSQQLTVNDIKKKGKLVVGTCADYPPYEFKTMKDGKMEIVGFDIDIANEFAKKIGVPMEVKDMDFKILIPSLQNGEVDIAVAGLNPSPEREKEIYLSNSYYDATQRVLVRKGEADKYKTKEDLEGKSLGAQMGSLQEEIAKSIKDAKVKSLPVITGLIIDLKSKNIDGIIMEEPVAYQYAETSGEFEVAPVEFKDQEKGAAIGIKKGNDELLEFVNENLQSMKADKTIDKFVVEATKLSEEANK